MILKIVLVTFISLVSNFMDTKEIALSAISILDEYEKINNRTQIQLTSSNYIKGDIFPKYSLKTLEGKMIDNNSFKGKYILIDFWATWCIPCVKKRPVLEEINKKFGDKIEIISISLDSEISTVQNFRKEKYRMDWNHSIKPKMINDPLIKNLVFKAYLIHT
ncbi:TlpA family protein disulfide reductase [Psychroserpens algicola]|uniref:TlpA family protein disulfide reductase n=1 Tax=Psychroserpens algicola TaxID=1719034 RepID=A0ABT0H5Y9_9FLAO|nr:TlpA disulfide reductase family protein [Psychroserpens algicola]MCK8479791.1 TlpA family protein disulfide reductase [Psychroserpens algicola]